MSGLVSRCTRFAVGCSAALIGALVGAATAHAQPRSFVVAPDGTDRAVGTLDAPLRTLDAAVQRVKPGDTIELRAGTYDGAVVRNPGTEDAWITLRAHANERAVIQGTGRGPAIYFYHRTCDEEAPKGTVCQPMYWEVRGLEVRGSADGQEEGYTVKIDTPRVRLVDNDLCCSRADVVKLVRTADDVEILHNRIHHPAAKIGDNAQGVDIVGADRTRVAFNHVHDIPSIGLYAKGNSRNTVFEFNRVERVWSNAIMLGQETDDDRLVDGPYETYDGEIRDNVVSEVGWACLATSSSWKPRIHHNTCWNTGQLTHGSVLVSNESEIHQGGTDVAITNNLIVGGSKLPFIRITSDAMSDARTLVIDRNVYATRSGAPGLFSWEDKRVEKVGLERWREATGLDRHSVVLPSADGWFVDTTSLQPKPGGPGWDAKLADDVQPLKAGCPPRAKVGARLPCPAEVVGPRP